MKTSKFAFEINWPLAGAKSGEKISEDPRLLDSQEYFECIAVGQASAGVTFLSLVRSLSVQKEKT